MAKTVIEISPDQLEKISKKAREKKNKPAKEEKEIKPLNIVVATMRDSFCDYTYQIMKGVGFGDKHNVKGNGVVTDDLINAFTALNKHFACIDDVFKHSGIEVLNIDLFENHELVWLYTVDGIKISGSADNESIVLSGSKHALCGGRSTFDSAKVALDSLSGYQWYNELKLAADKVRLEVELYREGKVVVQEEKKANPKQMKITDTIEENNALDFENNKL